MEDAIAGKSFPEKTSRKIKLESLGKLHPGGVVHRNHGLRDLY